MLKIYNTYIHIPFCERKCNYCDFTSLKGTDSQIEKYVNYLLKEIDIYSRKYDLSEKQDTIYFGGGTPSLLPIDNLKKILSKFYYDKDTEITIEVNPKTVDINKLKEYRKLGINRLSIGIQTFDDDNLKFLGRIHNSQEAIEVYNMARKSGFENISLDIMFSLPNQTLTMLQNDLEKLVNLNPNHISIYSLIWEEGTKFFRDLKSGKLKETDNDLEASMYEYIIEFLKSKGYIHYEISNFSKQGFESRHNSIYWENKNYLGVGLSAAGYLANVRYKNFFHLKDYYESLNRNILPIDEKEILTEEDIEQYRYLVGFRLLNKIIVPNKKYLEKCVSLHKEGYLIERENGYILSHKGLMLFNDFISNFIDI
ncbi:radical SAM family heme chaperone HemW [Fusobacterium simiae]|uniref:Heme chaperone HemW n=1 Tax=Fusobacterium simiae TaxID=855 RepID=A0ABT4DJG1_FUSSI|nr:radical SAM family heme chaperone HemW [Fusobacterium simiae]MCY7008741.1 radical SAM family heme chaperone HemW [Fusobacterium simiae]